MALQFPSTVNPIAARARRPRRRRFCRGLPGHPDPVSDDLQVALHVLQLWRHLAHAEQALLRLLQPTPLHRHHAQVVPRLLRQKANEMGFQGFLSDNVDLTWYLCMSIGCVNSCDFVSFASLSFLDVARFDLDDPLVAFLCGGEVPHVVGVDVAEEDEALHVRREVRQQRLEERDRLHRALLHVGDRESRRWSFMIIRGCVY